VSYRYYILAFREELRTRAHTCRIRHFFFKDLKEGLVCGLGMLAFIQRSAD
jgi:hypothetical protein